MNQRKAVLFYVVLLAVSLAAFAQNAAPSASDSAETVIQGYLQALKSGQYLKAAELMHPEALEKFRGTILPLVEETAAGDGEESLLPLFRDVPDIAALRKLSPPEFFAAFFGGMVDAVPGMAEGLGSGNITPLGSVPEGDTLHFVCRTSVSMDGLDLSEMEVVSLKRSGGNWRVLLSGEMEGIAQALRKAHSDKT